MGKYIRYEVNLYKDGAMSPIDVIDAPAGYTAEQYIADCEDNADSDYVEMLKSGFVTLHEVE